MRLNPAIVDVDEAFDVAGVVADQLVPKVEDVHGVLKSSHRCHEWRVCSVKTVTGVARGSRWTPASSLGSRPETPSPSTIDFSRSMRKGREANVWSQRVVLTALPEQGIVYNLGMP